MNGTVQVIGPNSTTSAAGSTVVGNGGIGTLTVTNGGKESSSTFTVATTGTATGTVMITNGGAVTTSSSVTIGGGVGSSATVTVDGSSDGIPSTWTAGTVTVGGGPASGLGGGTGELTISDGALVTTAGETVVGMNAAASGNPASNGTLNVNSQGTLQTLALTARSGSAQANFDGGILRALQTNPSFITHFSGNELNIELGGLTIDTQGFTVATDVNSAFSGDGALTKTGPGTLILVSNNDYMGGTTIAQGTLQLGNGGTTGSVTGNILDDGVLTISRRGVVTQNDVIKGGFISGSGILDQLGPGTLVLEPGNTYTGTTRMSGGILSIASAADLGKSGSLTFDGGTLLTTGNVTTPIPVIMAENGTINNGGNADTFSGQFTGPGGLTSTGGGTLILTGDNNYSGGTIIESGTFVAGRAAPIVEGPTDAFSTALGTGDVSLPGGTLRTTSFQNGVPLVISVGRNYTQAQNATVALGIGGLEGEEYDRVVVGRDATLDATLVVSSLNGFHPSNGDAFAILRAGGTLKGNFGLLDDSRFNTNPNLTAELRLIPVELVAPNGVLLIYVASKTPPAPPSQGPGPQPPIIEPVPDPIPPVDPEAPISDSEVLKLLNFSAQQLTSLYEISFSEANIQRFNLDDRMTQLQRTVFPPPPAPPPPTGKEEVGKAAPPPPVQPGPRWGVWANGWGDWAHIDSTSTALGYRFTTGGMSAGIDYLLTDHLAVGLFGGYSHTWVDFKPGSADVDTGRGGLYATYFDPTGWWVNAGVWGGYNSYSTSRQAVFGPANGSTDGYEISTFGEAGYNFHCGDLTWGPLVAMQYTDVHVSGFSEHGSLVPLDIHSNSQDSLRTDVGGQASYNWHLGKTVIIPGLKLAWEHEYRYSNLDISGSAPIFNNASATFNGPNLGHDSLIIEANLGVQITPQIATTIGYDGQLARDHYISNAVTGTVSFSF